MATLHPTDVDLAANVTPEPSPTTPSAPPRGPDRPPSNGVVTRAAHDQGMAAAANARTIVDQWLGTGLRFPLQPREGTGRIELVSGMELVRQSIETILDTDPGERVMQPLFGCGCSAT